MNGRRRFLAVCSALTAGLFAAGHARQKLVARETAAAEFVGPPAPPAAAALAPKINKYASVISGLHPDSFIADNLAPRQQPVQSAPPADIVLEPGQRETFESVRARLARLQRYVGFGNFNVIGWDEALRHARNQSRVGAFTAAELDFTEDLFFTNADALGFYGDKVVSRLSATIARQDIVKVAGSGHYLFKGQPLETYRRIRRDVGDSIVLTSGIRSVVKQIHLFLDKTARVDGNLSQASYSLAPPGHSYHAIGDFDVGKRGFGSRNFSAAFAETDEFRRLADLGYVDIRYPRDNPFGVRYEPWHIKVV